MAYATSSSQPAATVREVESRLSSPIRGASRPPRARWRHPAPVKASARTTAAASPAVRGVVQPVPIAVTACMSTSTPIPAHSTSSVRRHTASSQDAPSAAARSATARADSASSSDTHWRAAPAEWASAAGTPRPAAYSSRSATNAATALRCPSRAPRGHFPQVQSPP